MTDAPWTSVVMMTDGKPRHRLSLFCRRNGVNWHLGIVIPSERMDERAVSYVGGLVADALNRVGAVAGEPYEGRDLLSFPVID